MILSLSLNFNMAHCMCRRLGWSRRGRTRRGQRSGRRGSGRGGCPLHLEPEKTRTAGRPAAGRWRGRRPGPRPRATAPAPALDRRPPVAGENPVRFPGGAELAASPEARRGHRRRRARRRSPLLVEARRGRPGSRPAPGGGGPAVNLIPPYPTQRGPRHPAGASFTPRTTAMTPPPSDAPRTAGLTLL